MLMVMDLFNQRRQGDKMGFKRERKGEKRDEWTSNAWMEAEKRQG